jgi:hypothetical protein
LGVPATLWRKNVLPASMAPNIASGVALRRGLPATVAIASGVTVKVVENTSDTVHLILPPPPPEGDLSDEALDKVAAGFTASGGSSRAGWCHLG